MSAGQPDNDDQVFDWGVVPIPPAGVPYDEEDLAAEDAAIEEIAGEAPSSFDAPFSEAAVAPASEEGSIFDTPLEDAADGYGPFPQDEETLTFEESVPANEADPVTPPDLAASVDAADAAEAATEPPVASVPPAPPAAPASPASPEAPSPKEASRKDGQPHLRRAPKNGNGSKSPFTVSYKARALLAFVAIALFTVAVCMGMVAFIWNQFFTTYAANNIESLAAQTANRMAVQYERTLSLEGDALTPAREAAGSSDELGVMVSDRGGNILYNSAEDADGASSNYNPSAATQIAMATIRHNGQDVGTVRIWVYGSNTLMSKVDREFQKDTYLALICAGLLSLVCALVLGVLFARALVRPVNTVMKTARELSNGNLSARTGMRGTNEISCLGETIDEMAESFERDRKMEQRLMSDVAHELRTPLMAIQATVEAMIDGVYERDNEHLLQVDAEVARLSKLVDALLKLSRMEMRTQPMREEVVNLSELADDVVVAHQAFIEDSGLSIQLDAQPNVKTIGDADLIKQAIANLVSNAVRYTDEGGSITLSVFREGKMAAIAVRDTGIGLTPEEEKMVFSRFWRADSGRAKESGGLGIGLALVKEIMDRHHGRVSVKGEKGVGSVFTLYFPLYDEEKSIAQARMAVRAMERRQRGGVLR